MAVSARRKLVRHQENEFSWRSDESPSIRVPNAAGSIARHCALVAQRSTHSNGATHRKTTRMPFAAISLGGIVAHSPAEPERRRRERQPQQQFNVASGKPEGGSVPESSQHPAWRAIVANLAAGATAGCAVEAALYPIDTVKTRLQMATTGGGVRALFKGGGGKALYAGLWGNLVGVAPSTAVFMAVYEPIKQAVNERASPDTRHILAPLVAGASSGLAASFIRVPTEVVKQRMQSGEFVSAVKAVQGIVGREGFKGLFAGYGSFLLRDLPFDAIEFVSYEQMKRAYGLTLGGKREINPAETAAMGAIAGAITGILTTPFDVLKTRLMTQGSSGTYRNVGDCAAKIWQQEGWKTFFKGWEPRVLWISIGGCVFFSALEASKTFYHRSLGLPPPKPMH